MTLPVGDETFSRARIAAMAERMSLRITDDEQFAFLQSRESLHLQAAPGSGKTTLVALKLALLTQEWSTPFQGVCVLSHTNTAAEEIASRLAGTAGHRLLRRPHFIGTIQAFVHTFAALPALRSTGVTPRVIDDDIYAVYARRLLRHPRFGTLRNFVDRRANGMKTVTEATYAFEADHPNLQIPNTPFKRVRDSYKQLIILKGWLARDGIYRYDDMYAIGEKHLHCNPRLITGLRHRFPFVLIDEMQDTDTLQTALLSRIFGDAVIVQCVGDVNQYIYLDDAPEPHSDRFPSGDVMELPTSRRFGPEIAKVASRLTALRPQIIHGDGPAAALVAISFKDDSIGRVVPAFHTLVEQTVLPDAITAHPPKVLGLRRNPGDSQRFPRAITCYLPHARETAAASGNDLLTVFREAIAMVRRDGELRSAPASVWDTLRDLHWHLETQILYKDLPLRLPLLVELDRRPATPGHRIRTLIACALIRAKDNPAAWQQFTHDLVDAVSELITYPSNRSEQLHDLLAAYSPPSAVPQTAPTITSSTTAKAKGETHCATLVLECATPKGNGHDLGAILVAVHVVLPGDGFLDRSLGWV